MNKQLHSLANMGPHNTALISTMGLDHPEGIHLREGRSWSKHQVCRHETFSLVALEGYRAETDSIGYTKQEDYIKINFWLSGKHTTILDGFGQHQHERPEVFITYGPHDMIKVDILNRDTQIAAVALCLRRDFFSFCMGIEPEELPEPLRVAMRSGDRSPVIRSFALTFDLAAAARAILAAPFAVRREPLYAQAKAIELMCLLINRLAADRETSRGRRRVRIRRESHLYEARELLARHYAEPITLEGICRKVGINRMALTSGFRELFGMSVYDCLKKERMERAYDLLQDDGYSIVQVAEAVGYAHSCNFATAFRAHFGCTPQAARGSLVRRR